MIFVIFSVLGGVIVGGHCRTVICHWHTNGGHCHIISLVVDVHLSVDVDVLSVDIDDL